MGLAVRRGQTQRAVTRRFGVSLSVSMVVVPGVRKIKFFTLNRSEQDADFL